jgi:hypothetical protein
VIRTDEQLPLAQEAVQNLQLLLELQQREQDILTYLSSPETELSAP